jgi:hypothetical protein
MMGWVAELLQHLHTRRQHFLFHAGSGLFLRDEERKAAVYQPSPSI